MNYPKLKNQYISGMNFSEKEHPEVPLDEYFLLNEDTYNELYDAWMFYYSKELIDKWTEDINEILRERKLEKIINGISEK